MLVLMQELVLLLSLIYGVNFYGGKLLQKVRIPWIFTGLLLGTVLSIQGSLFQTSLQSDSFTFLAEIGVLFLLFIIGLSIDLPAVRKQGSFIVRSTLLIIFSEAVSGTLLMRWLFDLSWGASALVATSFATVGEAVLLPILEEFKLTQKKLGQTILGIGILDDIIEIIIILILSITVAAQMGESSGVIARHGILVVGLLLSPFILRRLTKLTDSLCSFKNDHLLVGQLMLFFLYVWVGLAADAPELAAFAAGVAIRNYLPQVRSEIFSKEMHTVAYGFFAPLFFVSVGYETNFEGVVDLLPSILVVAAVTSIIKVAVTHMCTRSVLGSASATVAGVALTVRLSTSIIVIKILTDNGIIPSDIYTVLISATILFQFINPPLLSYLITRWKIAKSS